MVSRLMVPNNTDPAPVTPRPRRLVYGEARALGTFAVQWEGAPDPRVHAAARRLLATLPVGTLELAVETIFEGPPRLGDVESYTLQRQPQGWRLSAPGTWGALHGLNTLYQLASAGGAYVVRIDDAPRFPWRGLLLDVARHFLPLAALEGVIDGLALLRMNVLHLHLCDDQAFRFGSRAWPELAADDHYTPAGLQALVAYAADRGVRIVPELDVPGHVTSWLRAYPEWGCEEAPESRRFGVHEACLNPADEQVYAALGDLLTELAAVFPDDYVHIGGDEVHPAWWRRSEAVQALQAREGLADVAAVQNYFNGRVVALLGERGKRPVAWDEVLHEAMPPMLVQNWRGATTRDVARAGGHDCLVSAPYYLDLFFPAEMHYAFDPGAPEAELVALEDAQQSDFRLAHVADGIEWTRQWRRQRAGTAALPGRIIGGEACLWSELVDDATLDVRLWSRLPAVAERFWTPSAECDHEDFQRRLEAFLRLPAIAVADRQHAALTGLGLSTTQVESAQWLEPAKWYSRLLGRAALEARL